ncbi:MAG: PAS domain-containing protein, partial [Leptospiraceae bacterium]|nr:PAS domain-containing protein [Leptospiraceae bacterium]
ESEARFRQVVEHIHEVFYMFDPLQNRMLYVSPAYERIWGQPVKDLYKIPETWLDAVHPEDLERVRERSNYESEGDYSVEYRIVRPDGSIRWVRDQSYPIQDANGRVNRIVGVAEDISERKAVEQALIQQDRQLIETQEIAHIGGWEWDVVKDTLGWTPEMYRILGLEPNAVAPRFEEYLEYLPTTDREQLRTMARVSFETKQGFDLNHRIIRSDGQTRIVYARVEVVTDTSGKVIRMRGTIQDVTAQRKLEEQLMQAQKLEAIGRLSGGIAHDFNNILTIIMGQLSLLEDYHFDADIAESIHHIKSATDRAASLTRQLLLFSRKEKVEMREVDLVKQMRDTIKMLVRLLGEDVSITFQTNEERILVHADPGMLDQIIMNLAVNARDAMPSGGRLICEAGIQTFDHLSAQQSAQIQEGTFACLTITDNGTGIPEDVLPNIFDPFFTTKSVNKGTGLGLSTVMGIVQQHNGWISVYTEAGVGTTFRIFLPIINFANNSIHTEGVFMNESGGAETILLVEDEDTI